MRYFIHLAYKGTDFHGWQNQPNAESVQAHIEKALEILLKSKTEITGCGRTDTGVHALNYFAHFDSEASINLDKFSYQLNALLPHTIVVYRVLPVHDSAHARFDAIARTYQYHILLKNDPFQLETTWQITHKTFNVEKMNEAANWLLSINDFQSFAKSNSDVAHYNCLLQDAFWEQREHELLFTITANRFLRNMVRAVVGTLLEIGEGKLTFSDFKKIIQSRNRSEAGKSVPAKGLFLTHIQYPFQTLF